MQIHSLKTLAQKTENQVISFEGRVSLGVVSLRIAKYVLKVHAVGRWLYNWELFMMQHYLSCSAGPKTVAR